LSAAILFIVLNALLGICPANTSTALFPYSSGYLGPSEPSVTPAPYSELITCPLSDPSITQTTRIAQNKGHEDIEWFKDKMKISPKYVERQEGILGMSWGHFFTMVFLVLFGSGALVLFLMRYKRTKDILKLIKEESAHGSES